ncbi:hypothetical protein HBI59_128540 [Parastagonospora nodorum]|nr:hypothetical protein HBI59_128540 [Parastagonospora nodorum]
MVKNTRNQQVRGGVALPPMKRAQPLSQTQESVKKLRTMQSATLLSLSRETILQSNLQDLGTQKRRIRELVQPEHESTLNKLDAYRSVFAQLMLDARIEVTAAYALNYLELRPASLWFLNSAIAAIIARAFYNNGKWALVGTVLYNAIKEYYDDGTRKTIYFHGYTVEDNYNAIPIHANHIENSRSNVTVPDDYHDNDVNNILMKCTDDERQRYNTLIEDYNRAGKREDNILTVDECRTGYSNEEDIEADEREEETRVRLRESSGEIHDILLREFRRADDFTESVTHNDNEQELEPEDCDALVERYEEEINCSDLYSTI